MISREGAATATYRSKTKTAFPYEAGGVNRSDRLIEANPNTKN